jgi:hypothetical protein
MNNIRGYAPYAKLHLFCDGERVVVWIFRHEDTCIVTRYEAFDGTFTVDQGNNDSVLPCIQGAISYQHIAFTYSGSFHGVARNPDIKRSVRMRNHQFIDVQFRLAVVISRGREATGNMPGNKWRRVFMHALNSQRKERQVPNPVNSMAKNTKTIELTFYIS